MKQFSIISHRQIFKRARKLAMLGFAVLLSVFMVGESSAQQLAFPGAEGFGKYTSGGRGGEVYIVTNLDDSGPGSLRHGVEMEGARTIVFALSGTIELRTDLKIDNDNISIFGQTAPGDGIALSGRSTVIDADNVIIQYVRFRPGDISTQDADGLDALWGRQNSDIMIDHVSMSWSVDETGSFYDNENFTLQWSILSESMYDSQHGKGTHGYGGIWGGAGATFHHNLLAHHTSRNPRFNGARYTTSPETELADFRNNVIYNWGGNSSYGGEEGNYNMVANYYKSGPATDDGSKEHRILDGGYGPFGKWYIEDNYVDGYPDVTANNWDGGIQGVPSSFEDDLRVREPFEAPELESFETAEEAFENVLAYAGAILPRRDTVDARVVMETRTGTATYGGVYGAGTGIIDSQEDVGGWPELLSAPAPEDSDQDGIPDEWETENDLDPSNPNDSRQITENGYSNLENYIHTIQAQSEFSPAPGTLSLLSPVGETGISIQPDFSWESASFAKEYQLQIRDGAGDFGTIIFEDTVETTTYSFPEDSSLSGKSTYFWRVRGLNDSGEGLWTNYAFFETEMTVSTDPVTGLPSAFALQQNYPNPFNPTTNIEYALPQSARVDLAVYDLTGRKVADLVQRNQQAGLHSVAFDASNLSSGVYIYRLNATASNGSGEAVFNLTRKMTLIK
ncbi:T9SS type A sorting domain-containing protein [Gracilimonas mengyeensis]|uniref:Por secretion system C-terminal sorting domain-containing protein n=1 Tax=Gracilimonas mengyeensis TaxID=1302730 RepID=A0A521FDJ7_9BACT|nr:T9SS type A sorting domain-containing protein [Gracilimonas mengyeensis]SMO94209.1 Por secretion system C-terminal sorting domain-containing protein [Gracilimonas mengyeensis]